MSRIPDNQELFLVSVNPNTHILWTDARWIDLVLRLLYVEQISIYSRNIDDNYITLLSCILSDLELPLLICLLLL